MKLVPQDDAAEGPGLWADPDWKPGLPGTFAVIIGVSRYRHLENGDLPTDPQGKPWIKEARSLDQLHVSALTAFRIFRWLSAQYRHEAPLARCWLLLSPTPAEVGHLSLGNGQRISWGDPTLAACSAAIRWWSATMRGLPAAAAAQSRGLFFFSGHGLESTQGCQLLLPSDYLAPPEPNINDAISTSNLLYGLGSLKVTEQLFFVDACRNDHKELRGKNMVGAKILVEEEAAILPPDLMTPVLYSTGPGQRSWEFRDPAKGISIYGQALLDGLAGQPNIALKGSKPPYRVELSPLEQFVRARVLELLKNAQSKERQYVKLGGQSDTSMNVTYVDRPVVATGGGWPTFDGHEDIDGLGVPKMPGGGRLGSPFPTPPNEAKWSYDLPPGGGPSGPPEVSTMLAAETPIREMSSTRRFSPRWLKDWNEGHRMFGSEAVTELWQKRTKVWLIGQKKWRGPSVIRIAEVSRDEGRGRYRVRMQITEKDPVGHWLQMTDELGGVHACMLPRDLGPKSMDEPSPVYEVSYDRSEPNDENKREIVRLDADLDVQSGPLGLVARLWRTYTTTHVAAAVKESEARELRNVIENKIDSPLGATVAALVLLRANRLDRLSLAWLRNLANWFIELPDAPILYAERRLREKQESKDDRSIAFQEAANILLLTTDRGIPRTSEAFEYGMGLARRLKDREELGLGVREKLHELERRLGNAFAVYRTGGLFSSFSGLRADLNADQLWLEGVRKVEEAEAVTPQARPAA
ncbi:hypothetical protein CQ14_15215 [Bradyrhizobium lablabi]|uniref:Peptidase C14 caspase domain-containing protein n=1 Tax=Bradyrhizobium lablabi TaxID=722472 RepID=A0A0R3MVM0_9BRAD|nr:caspase family protein [Bradyrhizobium lablabi]KRR24087.1 hypothetical protein CQ14_15215 [Bradyrhizobium lablabi]